MAELILRPDEVVDQGAWSLEGGSLIDALSDESDSTTVYNTNGNQSMTLSMTDIPEESEGETFTSLTVTIRAKVSGKGAASTNVRVINGEETISLSTHTISSSGITAYTSLNSSIDGMSLETLNGLIFYMIGLDNTQAFYSEVFFTLTYDEAPVIIIPPIKLMSGRIQLTSGKISI